MPQITVIEALMRLSAIPWEAAYFMFTVWFQMVRRVFSLLRRATSHVLAPLRLALSLLCVVTVWPILWWWRHLAGTAMIFIHCVLWPLHAAECLRNLGGSPRAPKSGGCTDAVTKGSNGDANAGMEASNELAQVKSLLQESMARSHALDAASRCMLADWLGGVKERDDGVSGIKEVKGMLQESMARNDSFDKANKRMLDELRNREYSTAEIKELKAMLKESMARNDVFDDANKCMLEVAPAHTRCAPCTHDALHTSQPSHAAWLYGVLGEGHGV